MEGLLNEYGWVVIAPVIVLVALPLMLGGLLVRRRGRRRADRVELAKAARCKLGDVAAGTVAVEGIWRALDGGRGILEDPAAPERRVLVERGERAAPLPDGATVLVVGIAVKEVDDPRGSSYRGGSRVWRIDTDGHEHVVAPGPDALGRASSAARTLSGVGAALFAAGLVVALASCVIAYRAVHDGTTFEAQE